MDSQAPAGLSVTLSWTSAGGRRAARAALGPALRVAAALSLCALCYQFGVWHARLEARVASTDAPRPAVAAAKPAKAASARAEGVGVGAPGQPVGQSQDVITPLNVRDPSALVMAPDALTRAPGAPAEPPKPRARLIPRPGEHSGPELRL